MTAMRRPIYTFLTLISLQAITFPVFASDFLVSVEIPQMDVAEYHRPYIAIWIADENKRAVSNLNVLYDVDMRNDEGEKWLKDIRQWWRRSGRGIDMPIDGISGATRNVGNHDFDFSEKVSSLEAGQYNLVIEAVREVGGREMVELSFQWPATTEEILRASGETEIGQVLLRVSP